MLSRLDLRKALRRHVRNQANPVGVEAGCRFLAAYRSSRNRSFWIITEADGRLTILLPDEYQK